jgi:RNA polymerase sporulation-specific sigma factor
MLTPEQRFDKDKDLAYSYVHKAKIHISGYELEDLFQVALIGLWKACKTYDETKSEFSTYATRCIENEIRMLRRRERSKSKITNVVSLEGLSEDVDEGLNPDHRVPRVESFEDDLVEVIDADNLGLTEEERMLLNMKQYMSDSQIKKLCHVSSRRMKRIRMKAKERHDK